MPKSYGAATAASHGTIYYFFIMIMIISIIMADYDYYDYYFKRLF